MFKSDRTTQKLHFLCHKQAQIAFFRKSTKKNGQKNAKNSKKSPKNDPFLDPPQTPLGQYVDSCNFFVKQYFYMIFSLKIVFCPRFSVFYSFPGLFQFLGKKNPKHWFRDFLHFFFLDFFFSDFWRSKEIFFSKNSKNFQNLKNQNFGLLGSFYRSFRPQTRSRKKVRALDIWLKKNEKMQKKNRKNRWFCVP